MISLFSLYIRHYVNYVCTCGFYLLWVLLNWLHFMENGTNCMNTNTVTIQMHMTNKRKEWERRRKYREQKSVTKWEPYSSYLNVVLHQCFTVSEKSIRIILFFKLPHQKSQKKEIIFCFCVPVFIINMFWTTFLFSADNLTHTVLPWQRIHTHLLPLTHLSHIHVVQCRWAWKPSPIGTH